MSESKAVERYVVHGPGGFTEWFDRRTVDTLVRLRLIVHDRDDYALKDGRGEGVGPLYHFYVMAPSLPSPTQQADR